MAMMMGRWGPGSHTCPCDRARDAASPFHLHKRLNWIISSFTPSSHRKSGSRDSAKREGAISAPPPLTLTLGRLPTRQSVPHQSKVWLVQSISLRTTSSDHEAPCLLGLGVQLPHQCHVERIA